MSLGTITATQRAEARKASRPVRSSQLALLAGVGCLGWGLVAPAASFAFAPVNTSPPTITGVAQQGQTLSEVHGSWTITPGGHSYPRWDEPTGYAYQWLRCNSSGAGCSPIANAVAQTYVPVTEDVGHMLRVLETANYAGGSTSTAESPATALVSSQPTATAPPTVQPTPVITSLRSATITKQGDALIPVGCPASVAGGCRGKITITLQIGEPHARRARAARCGRGCRSLGSANYEARAGQKISVRVHIASFGRHLVTRRKSVRVTLTATSVEGGQTATVTRAIALKATA